MLRNALPWLAVLTIGFLQAGCANQPANVVIQNEYLMVSVDHATHGIAIASLPSRAIVATSAGLAGAIGGGRRIAVDDPVFGRGQAIDWNGGRIELFPQLPFAIVQLDLTNASQAAEVLNRVPVASFDVHLSGPAAELTTLGTGGLLSADKNPGSYTWLAVAEPRSRNAVVAGWVTQDRASGVLFTRTNGNSIRLDARADYGRLFLSGASTRTEMLAIGYFDDGRFGLEEYADAVAKVYHIHLPPPPAGFCTWYAETPFGRASNENNLANLIQIAAEKLAPYGFQFVQIDDGWQKGDSQGNGPNKNFTDFRNPGPYAGGMKTVAGDISRNGLRPGIWFMPFAGTFNDAWFADKQNLFVKRGDGSPYTVKWGGTSLDMTNPAAREYLRSIVARLARDWGFSYFKMDGLFTGLGVNLNYVNSGYKEDKFGDAVLSDPSKTNVEAFRTGLKLVRQTAGPNVFFLGCTVAQDMRSYGASFGLVDAMRIGPDNSGSWAKWVKASPVYGSRHYFLNGRVWWNDPDPFYVRQSIPINEAETIASWAGITGGLETNSDWIPNLPADRLEIIKRVMPSHGRIARPIDYFENDPPRLWLVSDYRRDMQRDVIAVFNFSDKEEKFDVPLARFGLLADEYAAFDYWSNEFLPPIRGSLKTTVPPHGCKILAVRRMMDHPFVLSTSRHVTQGMIDVMKEDWNGSVLSGSSRIVAGDAYELRVYVPNGWRLVAGDGAVTQNGNGVRLIMETPTSRVQNWRIFFAK